MHKPKSVAKTIEPMSREPSADETPSSSSEHHIPLRACFILGIVGVIVASLPHFCALPRRADAGLYGLGSMAFGNAVLVGCFREIRYWNGRGVIPFESRTRKIASMVLVIVLFGLICVFQMTARTQGWWR